MHPVFAGVVEQAVANVRAAGAGDISELELRLENEIAHLAAELTDADLHALAEAQPHLYLDRTPDYFPDGPETGVDLIERNLRELAVEQALLNLAGATVREEATGHKAGVFRVDLAEDGTPQFRVYSVEAQKLLDQLGQHSDDDQPFVRQSLQTAAASHSGEFASRYILSELYLELVERDVRSGWLYDSLRDLLAIKKTPEQVADERAFAEQVLAQAGVQPLDVQHPFNAATGKWMAHCVRCGSYVDDTDHQPAADFLCDDCEERDE